MKQTDANNSRDLVRVAGELVEVGAEADWRGLVATFVSMQDVAESSRKLYTRTLTQFFRWLEDSGRLANFLLLTRRDVLAYKDYLESQSLSDLTIGSYIVAVRKFYAWAEAEKQYPNIAKGVKVPRKQRSNSFRKQHLTTKESKALLQHFQTLSLRDYAIVNLVLRTGLRTVEVVRADIEDITTKKTEKVTKRVLLVQGKGHREKDDFVVLTEEAYKPIKQYLETRRGAKAGEPLFTSTSHNNSGQRLTTRTISYICKEGLKAIGLDDREHTAHSLRHTTASTLAMLGASLPDIQNVLRHRSPVTTQIYLDSIKEQMQLENSVASLLDAAF